MSQSFIRHKFVHSKIGSENISTLKDRSFDVVFQHCTVKTKYIFKNIVAMKKNSSFNINKVAKKPRI